MIASLAMAAGAAAGPEIEFRAADSELLRRVLVETRVTAVPEKPAIAGYVGTLVAELFRSIGRMFSAVLPRGAVEVAQLAALAVLAAALSLLILSIFRRVRGRTGSRPPFARRLESTAAAGEAPVLRGREAWERELQLRLVRGDASGALEALWWWLAASVSTDEAIVVSWTTRELLTRSRRPELLPAGRELDVLMYGPIAPSPAEVTACLARLDRALR